MTQPVLPDPPSALTTGIVVMVPEARSVVAWAHITLLAPFGTDQEPTSDELAELERYFADQPPFPYELTQLCRFPTGISYLSPEPVARFSRMTHDLHQLFPEYPPYAGQFDLVVPHLTVPDNAAIPDLPIRAYAREATVFHLEEGVYAELAAFPLGASAA